MATANVAPSVDVLTAEERQWVLKGLSALGASLMRAANSDKNSETIRKAYLADHAEVQRLEAKFR